MFVQVKVVKVTAKVAVKALPIVVGALKLLVKR